MFSCLYERILVLLLYKKFQMICLIFLKISNELGSLFVNAYYLNSNLIFVFFLILTILI